MSIKDHFAAARTSGQQQTARGIVTNSMEFQRIFGLPRRVLDLSSVPDTTPLFARTGKYSVWPIQSAALVEAATADGLFAMLGVGWGKTFIGLALPEAMDSTRTVYLVRSDLKEQLKREADEFYNKHFILPLDRITIVSYDDLSSERMADILERVDPDLVVADEAHCLKHKEAARTKRFLRFMKEHVACRFAALSGTMTLRSPVEYGHLIELALRKNSPLPHGYRELRDWAGALAVRPDYIMGAGVLRRFCDEGETVRSGFRRRLVETPGVVATSEGALGTSLIIRKLTLPVPADVKALTAEVNKLWSVGGEEFDSPATKARVLRQLATGFYYRWEWPNGVPDDEWLDARAAWNKEVRQKLKYATEGMDTPMLLARAAERFREWEDAGRPRPRPLKAWDSVTWRRWSAVKDRKEPPTVPVWVNDFVVDYSLEWAKKQDAPAIIWYESVAVGERIASKGGLPLYDAGTDAAHSRDDAIVASINAQGTGKQLQHHFSRNLLVPPPSNGTIFEQLAGRTHRPGQEADEVTIDWLGHTTALEDAMASVIEDARYQQSTTGMQQKVLYATRINR